MYNIWTKEDETVNEVAFDAKAEKAAWKAMEEARVKKVIGGVESRLIAEKRDYDVKKLWGKYLYLREA
jgi:hypothetical protein